MGEKIYKFSYGNRLKKFISMFIFSIYDFMIGCILLFIISLIVSKINYKLKFIISDNVMAIIKAIGIFVGIVLLCLFVIQAFLPQKVTVNDKMIKISRHCLFFSPLMISRGFNDTILISQIKEIYRPKNKDVFMEPIPVNVVDWDNMVIVKINNSMETLYYMPVENSDDFIAEVNERKKRFQMSSNDTEENKA